MATVTTGVLVLDANSTTYGLRGVKLTHIIVKNGTPASVFYEVVVPSIAMKDVTIECEGPWARLLLDATSKAASA